MKLGKKTLSIALLFVGLLLINYLASSLPWRTVVKSAGDLPVCAVGIGGEEKLSEPMTFDFYFSRGANGLPVFYKNYAERVREMLRQYVRASHGRISLKLIDPEPDTQEEEKATAAGLQPQRMQTGG